MRPICRGLLILLAPLLPVATAAAQSFSGGVIAGVRSSTVSNFGNIGPTTLRRETGLVAGFSVEASLARFASLQPEVVYVRKGTRLEGPLVAAAPSSASASIPERFDYIEVPMLVRLGATAGRPGLYVLAGPAVAVLVRARERFEVPGLPTQDQDIKGRRHGHRCRRARRRRILDRAARDPKDASTPACGTSSRRPTAGDRERTHRSVSVAARLRF
jgi:hypothetical protein